MNNRYSHFHYENELNVDLYDENYNDLCELLDYDRESSSQNFQKYSCCDDGEE